MSPLAAAMKNAQKQGLISLRGVERDLGLSRNTARRAMRGELPVSPTTEAALWKYLRQRGATGHRRAS